MSFCYNEPLTVYADFETTSYYQYLKEGETRVYLGGFCTSKSDRITYYFSVRQFFDYLLDFQYDYKVLNIYFHNLGFDVSFILYYLNSIGYKHYLRKKDEYDLPEYTYDLFISGDGKIYSLKLQYNGLTLIFKDSLKKLPASISALGKIVGLPKLAETHDYTEDKPVYHDVSEVSDEELSYLRNDILILKRAMELYGKDINFQMSLTSSSMTYNSWLQWYLSKPITPTRGYFKAVSARKDELRKLLPDIEDEDMNTIISRSYRGGISYLNPVFANKEVHGISYDVNSLYPFSVIRRDYPCGTPTYVNEINDNELQIITFITLECTCNSTIPFVPIRRMGHAYEYSKTLPCGVYTLWREEFQLFVKHYSPKYEIVSILQFSKVSGLFDGYMLQLGETKTTTKDPGIRYMTKLKMNGLGGKFGTKTKQFRKICAGNTNIRGGLQFVIQEPEEGEHYYKPISSYMTSQARCYLVNSITPVFYRFIYCDTDSMYLYGEEPAENIRIHPTELGAFKQEHTFSRGKFLHSKCYMIEEAETGELSISLAGCGSNAKQYLNFENFKFGTVLKDVNLKALQVKGGVVLKPTDFEIKEV